jgi:hypothetical protein
MYVVAFLLLFFMKSFTYGRLNKTDLTAGYRNSIFFIPYIFIQQAALFVFWLFFRTHINGFGQFLILGVLFALAHTHLFLRLRKVDGYILFLSSFLGGIIFAYLYSNYYVQGLWTAFLIHISFHIILDIVFIAWRGEPMKYYEK